MPDIDETALPSPLGRAARLLRDEPAVRREWRSSVVGRIAKRRGAITIV